MCLNQACTSTPFQAIASGGPVLTNSWVCIASEKLLADSCNTQTIQLTRLNSIPLLLVLGLAKAHSSSRMVGLWSTSDAVGESAAGGMHLGNDFWDIDTCVRRICFEVGVFASRCLSCSFTLILDEHGVLPLKFNLSSDRTAFLQKESKKGSFL